MLLFGTQSNGLGTVQKNISLLFCLLPRFYLQNILRKLGIQENLDKMIKGWLSCMTPLLGLVDDDLVIVQMMLDKKSTTINFEEDRNNRLFAQMAWATQCKSESSSSFEVSLV